MTDFTSATWRKSLRSGGGNQNCVELASVAGTFGVRDSKDKRAEAPILSFGASSFSSFIGSLKAGRFDR